MPTTQISPRRVTASPSAFLRRAIADRTARVGVIGLGYVGLPLVELFAGSGFPSWGSTSTTPRSIA